MDETRRQLVHLSGALFILLAQFTGSLPAALMFLLISLSFLAYSLHLRSEQGRLRRLFRPLGSGLRERLLHLERPGIPMQGAFWFYFACFLTFLLFPLKAATAACLILALADSVSTLVGRVGRFRILGPKTLEGTLAFFLTAAMVSLAFFPERALLAAAAATLAELLPAALPRLSRKGILDDNLTIPLFAALAFTLI